MNLWRIAWSYLWNRRLTTMLTIFSVALGVGLISTVLTLREETRRRFEEEGKYFDIVVGAKGNPLQLVLSTVYFLDSPPGIIHAADLEKLRGEPEVQAAYPIGMGDSYRGYRIVSTDRSLMDYAHKGENLFTLAEGNYFEKPFEAVLGAAVAQATGKKVGDTFVSTHGFIAAAGSDGDGDHKDKPYTIVGILKPSATAFDQAIYCDMESIWQAHEHPHDADAGEDGHDHNPRDLITAALVKLKSPALRFEFKKKVNLEYNAMAVVPIDEIKKLYDQLLSIAKAVLLAIGYLVVVISSLSILIGLYMAILQRKRDLAIMRALGATRGEIFGAVLIEAFWVTLLGLGAGWLLGTGVCVAVGSYLASQIGFRVGAIAFTNELVTAYSAVLLMGIVAGILPAWQAYRTNVARDLAEL